VTLLCRLLFEPRDAGTTWPPPGLGMANPEAVATWPHLFPLAVAEGMPFLVTNGYILGGVPEPGSTSLAFAEDRCRLVAALPVPSGDPLDAAGAVVATDEIRTAFPGAKLAQVRAIVRRQAYLMRRETHGWDHLGPVGLDAVCCDDALYERKWAELLEVAHRWPVRWDAEAGAFIANPPPR
jgi:hypothetical protein